MPPGRPWIKDVVTDAEGKVQYNQIIEFRRSRDARRIQPSRVAGVARLRAGGGVMSPYERRLQLLAAGYPPLPFNGKAPVLPWCRTGNAHQHQPERSQALDLDVPWGAEHRHSHGLTPALDIDILDLEAADAIEKLICDHFVEHGSVLPRVGQAAKRAILFRTDTPFPKITANLVAPNGSEQKIEFLGDGQQAVVDGIHPTTRQPYRWPQGCVGDVKHDDLPLISEQEARQLIDNIVDLLTKEHGYLGERQG